MDLPKFLIEMLQKQYGEEKTEKIIAGYSHERPVTFRVNTLKTSIENVKKNLKENQIEIENVAWCNEAFVVINADKKKIEDLDLYQNGEIYLQSLSSMLPPIILNPKENLDLLDMAAAPGGKTTQIACLTHNKSHITACEMNAIRAERLKYNIEKQGATSVYVMQTDSRKIDDFFSFDQILLDAPCSGSGTLNLNDLSIEKIFTMKLINKSVSSQISLLKKALKILKPGQEMVYSTCSILACENEDVVDKVLKETNNAEIVPIEFSGIENSLLLPSKISGTLCICPNELYEGFFIAKIRRKS